MVRHTARQRRFASSSRRPRTFAETLEARRLLAAIASDQTVTSTIGAVGEADDYTIACVAGETLAVAVADAGNTAFTPRIAVIAPGGATLAADYGGNGTKLYLNNLAAAGTYTVRVTDNPNAQTGSYTLTVARTIGGGSPNDGNGGAITSGQRKLGSVVPGDIDLYTFTAGAGESAQLALAEVNADTAFVPEVVLYGPSGAYSQSDYSGVGIRLSATNLAAGTYTVLVVDHGANLSTGEYALSLAKLPAAVTTDPNDADGGAIASGQRRRGNSDLGDLDVFTFTANINQSITLSLGDVAGTSYVPELAVYSPTGAFLAYDYSDIGVTVTLNNLAASGTYYAVVYDRGDSHVGEYALTLAKSASAITADPTDPDGGTITNGERRVGQITAGDSDVFTFTANIGQSATLTVGDIDASGFTPQINVYNPSGTYLTYDYAGNGTRIDLNNFTVSGVYTVMVFDRANGTGRYALALAKLTTAIATDTTDSDGGTIAVGATRVGSVPLGDSDVYSFAAVAGTAYTVRVQDLNADAFSPRINVYAATGNYVTYDTNGALAVATFTPTASGTYSIVVSDDNGDSTGTYGLGLNTAAPTVDAVAPRVVSASFDYLRAPHEIHFAFSESVVNTVDFDDVVVRNNTTGQDVFAGSISAVYDANNYEGIFSFPGETFGVLPNGAYTARFNAGAASDPAGNANPAFSFDFFVLAGDVNRDRVVNFTDLLAIAQNYGKFGRTFAEGNIDYSPTGNVGFEDLLLLAQNYAKSVVVDAPATGTPAAKRERSLVADVLA